MMSKNHHHVTVHVGDCLTNLRNIPDKHVQCCVTSPPYWGLRDYKTPEVSYPEITFTPMPGLPPVTVPEWSGHLGLEADPLMFVAHMVAIFREVCGVLKDDGTLWMNFGDSYNGAGFSGGTKAMENGALSFRGAIGKGCVSAASLKPKDLVGMPWRVAFALQADGWYLRQDIIWSKPNPMPETLRDRCTKAHEYIFLLTKSARYHFDTSAIAEPVSGTANPRGSGVNPKSSGTGVGFGHGTDKESRGRARVKPKQNESFSSAVRGLVETRNKRSVWTVPSAPFKGAHFATYPPALITPCILAGSRPGDIVMDIFGGSGTTGQVALENGRQALLFELSEEYAKIITKRTDVTPGFAL